ncbi:Hypothetical protein HVR_LOCUS783 [uncultured virus]|nr:Hypothetical protein HVR_LOCUS783 [uncultured virus]
MTGLADSEYLLSLCIQDDFSGEQIAIVKTCVNEFLMLNPRDVLHYLVDDKSPHQERDLLSHIILALKVLHKTDRFQSASSVEKFRLTITVLLHDTGKAIQWKSIDTSTRWHFRGHDAVGACWFWSLVKKYEWDELFMRPIFLAIWFHMVRSQENVGLLAFLAEHHALPTLECLHCSDNYGRAEVQHEIGDNLHVESIPQFASVPNLPIVVYLCGKSGVGKTTMARHLIETMPEISVGYVSFDRSMLRVLGNITTPWADADIDIRGKNLKVPSTYKTLYDQYQKNTLQREMVRQGLAEDFKTSTENNTVTIFTSTVTKPSVRSLPFMSQRFLSIVSVPDHQDTTKTFFGSLRMSMEAARHGCGWSAQGALLYVPERELISCIRHLIQCRTMPLNPPSVSRPSELISLFEYWKETTGSLESMKYAMESFYEVQVSIFKCAQGSYYNFAYRDGAPYDDPFHRGRPSPAVFCRGTTFHYYDNKWILVRLPMNRGREIAFTPIGKSEVQLRDPTQLDPPFRSSETQSIGASKMPQRVDLTQDANVPTVFYSDMLRIASTEDQQHLLTAKVDGALLIVFKDLFHLEQIPRSLRNSCGLAFGTKGMVLINGDITNTFLSALKQMSHTVQSFSEVCFEYMTLQGVDSLSFEMVAEKRRELVVEYPETQRGLYFLGASIGDMFKPFFTFEKHPCQIPITKSSTIQDASRMLLGPFPEHLEGSVIWILHEELYFPLKLKTLIYYLMHKPKARSEYNDYLMNLIQEYGWSGVKPLTRDELDDKKFIMTLFSMVNLPHMVLKELPILRKCHDEYNRLFQITGSPEELKPKLSREEYQAWCKFNNTYGAGRYSMAYELVSRLD